MISKYPDNKDNAENIVSILACDIGNTNISLACVTGDDVENKISILIEDSDKLADTLTMLWERLDEPKRLVACSVNPDALGKFEKLCAASIGEDVIVISRDIPAPIATKLANPESIGTDRLCAAAAAFNRLNSACVVADFGSAVTIDCVDNDGNFLGGAIMPGLGMSVKALKQNTAQLPQVELRTPDWTFGADTSQAIIGGIVYGARGALREFIEKYATELGSWPLVVLTGGDAKLICDNVQESGLVQAVVDDLVLRGVALAYYLTLP